MISNIWKILQTWLFCYHIIKPFWETKKRVNVHWNICLNLIYIKFKMSIMSVIEMCSSRFFVPCSWTQDGRINSSKMERILIDPTWLQNLKKVLLFSMTKQCSKILKLQDIHWFLVYPHSSNQWLFNNSKIKIANIIC